MEILVKGLLLKIKKGGIMMGRLWFSVKNYCKLVRYVNDDDNYKGK